MSVRVVNCIPGLAFSGLAATLLSGLAVAGAPFSFDAAPGRLPKDVVPLDYTLAITPDIGALTFSGTEQVKLEVRTATRTVVFNSLNEKLAAVRFDGKPVAKVVSDDEQQLTTVTLSQPAHPGTHSLTFSYQG